MTEELDDEALDKDEERALQALASAERLNAPDGFADGVMGAVRERAATSSQLPGRPRVLGDRNPEFWSPASRRQANGGGGMSSRKLLLGIAAVAVMAIGYFAVMGYPPVGPGSEGAVGAAKRYESEQMSRKDLKLENSELQAFMQTDTFQRLIADRAVIAALSSASFRDAVASKDLRDSLASKDSRDALASQDFRDALASKDFRDALASKDLRDALAGKDFRDALANQSFRDALANKDFRDALASRDFRDALANKDFRDALASQDFRDALAKVGARDAAAARDNADARDK